MPAAVGRQWQQQQQQELQLLQGGLHSLPPSHIHSVGASKSHDLPMVAAPSGGSRSADDVWQSAAAAVGADGNGAYSPTHQRPSLGGSSSFGRTRSSSRGGWYSTNPYVGGGLSSSPGATSSLLRGLSGKGGSGSVRELLLGHVPLTRPPSAASLSQQQQQPSAARPAAAVQQPHPKSHPDVLPHS